MKASTLEKLTDDQLIEERVSIDREIKRRIAQSERHVAKMREAIEPSGNHRPQRKRRSFTPTPTHIAISRTVQELRHARERKDSPAIIKKLESKLEKLRAELARANKKHRPRSRASRGIRRQLRALGHRGGVRGTKEAQ